MKTMAIQCYRADSSTNSMYSRILNKKNIDVIYMRIKSVKDQTNYYVLLCRHNGDVSFYNYTSDQPLNCIDEIDIITQFYEMDVPMVVISDDISLVDNIDIIKDGINNIEIDYINPKIIDFVKLNVTLRHPNGIAEHNIWRKLG